jgi:Tfp pilus assembly protein PilO
MRNFQLKKQFILAALAVLLLADVALIYFNSKLASPQENQQQSLAGQARELALVKADVQRATEIRRKIPDVLKGFDKFESTLLPASKGYSVILEEMDQYAHDSRLIVEDVKYHEKDVKDHGLTELTLESSVTGDYNGIVTFLNHLQRSKNNYIVDSLNVESQLSGQAPVGVLRVNLHMRTYFRKA